MASERANTFADAIFILPFKPASVFPYALPFAMKLVVKELANVSVFSGRVCTLTLHLSKPKLSGVLRARLINQHTLSVLSVGLEITLVG